MTIELDNLPGADGENTPQDKNLQESNVETYKTNDNEAVKAENEIPVKEYATFSFDVLIDEAKDLLNKHAVHQIREHFAQIKEAFKEKIEADEVQKKESFLAEGGDAIDFRYESTYKTKFNVVYNDFKNQLTAFHKENERKEKDNLEIRLAIIEELKSLYQDSNESSSTMFKKFRELKTRWHNAGKIPSAKAENIFKNYFFHLDNFYSYLDLNKELQSLDYNHNLEVRKSIIKRAEELIVEPNVQKALNELQYLHLLWKEEAVPVAEEFRELTWQRFKELTNKIHDRKAELNEKMKLEQAENLVKKMEIISQIEAVVAEGGSKMHGEWQKAIKKVNTLRDEFLAIGRVPKDKNTKTWDAFKQVTRNFNHLKNEFYKNLKTEQQDNLQKKLALLDIAKEHQESTDWDESVRVIKKIQNDWKNIGHVPRKNSDKIWKDFKETCNTFFDRYKKRNEQSIEELEANFVLKSAILEELTAFTFSEKRIDDLDRLNAFNQKWAAAGKVPSEKLEINQAYTQLFNQKLKELDLSKTEIQNFKLQHFVDQLKSTGNARQLDDEIRRTKKTIEDLEREINQLDNNVNFFANADKNNPLLKDVYRQIEEKRTKLTEAEIKLRTLFSIDL